MASSHNTNDALAAPRNGGHAVYDSLSPAVGPALRRIVAKAQPIRTVRLDIPEHVMQPHAQNGPNGQARLVPSNGVLARKVRLRVRAAMRERYLTQWDVALACGITQSTLSAWLCGRKDLSGTHLLAVLEALEIDLSA
jgi:hypothetical protein